MMKEKFVGLYLTDSAALNDGSYVKPSETMNMRVVQ